MTQSLMSGNITAFFQAFLDYETIVLALEQQIVQDILIDFPLL
jgi:hypothetical protein